MSSNLIKIEDEDLIEELRRYGEKNLPSTSSMTSSKKKINQINEQNREILVKKLNHYKAKEKAELNPSKYLKRQSFGKINNSIQITTFKHEQDNNNINDNNDVIELNETSEYVQVNNAFTSPLSISSNEFSNKRTSSNSRSNTVSPLYTKKTDSKLNNVDSSMSQFQNNNNLVSLKDKLELDKTLSKYRSEINQIITSSIVKNRKTDKILNNYLNNDNNFNEKDVITSHFIQPCQSNNIIRQDQNKDEKNVGGFINSFKFLKKENVSTGLFSPNKNESQYFRKRRENTKNALDNQDYAFLLPTKYSSNNLFSNFMISVRQFISNIGLQISKILPFLVIIIFTVILLQYVRMKIFSNSNYIQTNIEVNHMLLQKKYNSLDKVEHNYCDDIKNVDCSDTKLMIRDLIDYLRYKSGQIDCTQPINIKATSKQTRSIDFIEKSIHITKIIKYLSEEKGQIIDKTLKSVAITSMLSAINKNPHWHLRLLNSSHADTNDLSQVTYIMSSISTKSILCRIVELLHFLYLRLIMITIILMFLFFSWFIYKTYSKNRMKKDKEFFQLVSKVTNVVENHYELSLLDPVNIKPYIAISHIYDEIFEPSVRASNKKLWSKVVKFIQDHESRIHLSTEFIDGEENHVWKWVVPKHINSLSPKITKTSPEGIGLANSTMIHNNLINTELNQSSEMNLNKAKNGLKENINNQMQITFNNNNNVSNNGWQGDAFNRSDKLIQSPTPCLKIRNMFDSTEILNDSFLIEKIHTDILKKFNSTTNLNENSSNSLILHISCDKRSKEGCVYIKCRNNEGAGKIYQSLNGTWYNGKLLNVKFLRSDRYLERFPESINFTNPLKPIKI